MIAGGEKREARSSVVEVEVAGAPQAVAQAGEVVGLDGSDVRLEAEFCSDPHPTENTWQWDEVSK